MKVSLVEGHDGDFYTYKTSGLVEDLGGFYGIDAKSIIPWPNEGINQIEKTYINKDTYTM